jgi:DNA-binding NtrC family response regulator
VDVRVLAATNRDLVAEVKGGRFRSDLFARLFQWPVHLPALRERREDIPLLMRHLLKRKKAAHLSLSTDLAEALMLHPWPFNVRGLVNVLSVATIAACDGELGLVPEVEALLAAERALAAPIQDRAPLEHPMLMDSGASRPGQAEVMGPDRTLESTQPFLRKIAPPPSPEALSEALTDTKGSVAAAARSLGCSRQQVYRALEQAGWTLEQFRP